MKSLWNPRLFVFAIISAIIFRFLLGAIRRIPMEDWAEKKVPFFGTLVYGIVTYILLLVQKYIV